MKRARSVASPAALSLTVVLALPVAVTVVACRPVAGYRSPSLSSDNAQRPAPPTEVRQAGASESLQDSPPPRALPPEYREGEVRPPSRHHPAPLACVTDADCVPDGCCHPIACVPASSPPPPCNEMCTRECRPGTLDCGGHCACQAGLCSAVIARP